MFRVIFYIFSVLSLLGTAHSATVTVPDDYSTIQAAINAAGNHDTVLVKPGTYVENIDFSGKAITVRSESGPEVTTIDGNQAGSVVRFINSEDDESVLEGFTITNGTGTYKPSEGYFGGGIYCELTRPTITGNIVTANGADSGGGIFCRYPSSLPGSNNISNNTISGNTGEGIVAGCIHISNNTIVGNDTGILCLDADSTLIEGNIITGNTACGISSVDSVFVEIDDNVITDNGSHGIGLADDTYRPIMTNNLVVSNSGAGISCVNTFKSVITSNTLHDNSMAGVYASYAEVDIINSIIWQNSVHTQAEIWLMDQAVVDISYSDVEEGLSGVWVDSGCTLNWGSGMIDDDPLFYRPENDFFYLRQAPCQPYTTNPCVDTGDPSSTMIIGSTRTDGVQDSGAVDMGFHYPIGTGTLIFVPDDYSTIQDAIVAAAEDAVVIVRPGTYNENIDFLGKAITVLSEKGPYSTIIDGQGAGSVVALANGEGADTVLDGFTLTNGNSFYGGGIYCMNATSVIRNNVFKNNTATSRGGGIYCRGSDLTLFNNLFFGNQAGDEGGGICCWGGSPVITNGTFHMNSAHEGGAVFNSISASPVITSSILWNNFAPVGHEMSGGNPVVTYCDIEEDWPGTGNIDANPLFVIGPRGDYYLGQIAAGDPGESPCVNAGDPLSGPIDGTTRRDGETDAGVVDMGFHYPDALYVPGGYSTIQNAIDAALDGDIVIVRPGTYLENIDFAGKDITVRSEQGAAVTIIDGAQNGSVVTCVGGETNVAVLSGFTLTNGSADRGGGINIDQQSSLTITNNVVIGNQAVWAGGGIHCSDSVDPMIASNVISDNSAYQGAGLHVWLSSNAVIANNLIYQNSAGHEGGGLFQSESVLTIENTLIAANSAGHGGGVSAW